MHSVLAEQDSQYNRSIELERLLLVSTAASDAKSRELHQVLALLSMIDTVTNQVLFTFTYSPHVF